MKIKNPKVVGLTIIGIILILIALPLSRILKESTKDILEEKESLITKQMFIDSKLETTGYTVDNPKVVIDPYNISPLSALILFETEEVESPEVIIVGQDKWTTFAGSSGPSKQHRVPVYGLYAGCSNEVILKVGDKRKVLEIETEALPEDLSLPVEIKSNKELIDGNELYFFTPATKGHTAAYDVNGDVRWYLTESLVWDISRLKNGNLMLSTERPINPPYFTTGLYEIDLLGRIHTEYTLPGGYHHDFFELNNGNLLVASDDFDNAKGTVEDYVVELNRETGEVEKYWDLKDILNMNDGKSENWVSYDWFHNNSIWYDENTNSIILSGRHKDAVISIDYDTGNLNWILGDNTGWYEDYQEYFFTPEDDKGNFEWQWSQHAAMITPEGYVFLLDNGNNKSKLKEEYVPAKNSYTRGVLYQIDTDKMTIKQVWQYGKERGYEFYSPYISDVDYLNKDHYIVHSGGIVYVGGQISNRPAGFDTDTQLYSTTVEILDDQEIFQITLPTNMYRVEKMPLYQNLSGNPLSQPESLSQPENLSQPRRLGRLGITEPTSEESFWLPFSAKDIKKFNGDVSLTKEEDRLIVKGAFNNEDKVEVILYKGVSAKFYDVVVSKKPYTALCLDIFVQEEHDNIIEIEKYINQEGLSGVYSVYLKVNNSLYDTNKRVEF